MSYLFTSESVSEGHPDKVADQISDAILDEFLRQDSESKVACETFVSTGLVVIGGEVRSEAYVDIQQVARKVINRIGYTKAEYMFEYMPLPISLSHRLLIELADIRKNTSLMPYLRPDAKSQFTIEYSDDNRPLKVHTIVVSTQHDEFADDRSMQQRIREDIESIVIPRLLEKLPENIRGLFKGDYKLLVNPTGKFVIGGPHGDTGLTGRKIVVDTYGGRGAHGGGALSGKDASKVDRSAAYAARYIAKNLVAAGVASEVLVQIAYAIGVAEPVSIFINTRGTCKIGKSDGEIARAVGEIFDLRPAKIIEKFGLTNPIFEVTAAYGHMGREPYTSTVEVTENGIRVKKEVKFFGWEETDAVELIKKRIIS